MRTSSCPTDSLVPAPTSTPLGARRGRRNHNYRITRAAVLRGAWRAPVYYVVSDVASTGAFAADDVASTGTLRGG
jgi:hypothetical protein